MNFKRNILSIILAAILVANLSTINNVKGKYNEISNNAFLDNPLSLYMQDKVYVDTDIFNDIIKDIVENDVLETSIVSYSTVEEPIIHIVTSTDNLWNLAKHYYGNGSMFYVIMQANNLYSTLILDGQELIIPKINNIPIVEEVQEDISVVEFSTTETTEKTMEYLSNFKITGYDPWCKHCCSKTDGITASGVEAVVGRTVACNKIAMGTEIYIEGYGYFTVEDTGGMKGNVIDIACNSHDECYAITNREGVAVYIIK